jgi:hypothetical protein
MVCSQSMGDIIWSAEWRRRWLQITPGRGLGPGLEWSAEALLVKRYFST